MHYALLIYRNAPISTPMPELEERQALALHRELQREASSRGELSSVARLDDVHTARTVRRRPGGHDISDGPYIETKEWLVGFYLVECEGEDQAVERAKQICGDDYHAIEVRPVTWRWHP
jgi:hypothetical protein